MPSSRLNVINSYFSWPLPSDHITRNKTVIFLSVTVGNIVTCWNEFK